MSSLKKAITNAIIRQNTAIEHNVSLATCPEFHKADSRLYKSFLVEQCILKDTNYDIQCEYFPSLIYTEDYRDSVMQSAMFRMMVLTEFAKQNNIKLEGE